MNVKRIILCAIALLLVLSFGCNLRTDKTAENRPTPVPDPPKPDVMMLFPEAVGVSPIDFDPDVSFGDQTYITRAETVFDKSGERVGYAIGVKTRHAYNPPLELLLGVSANGTTRGIVFLELNETPGKGSKADEPAFRDQFAGRSVDTFVLNGNVDAISGATITSKAVVNALNAGLAFFREAILPGR